MRRSVATSGPASRGMAAWHGGWRGGGWGWGAGGFAAGALVGSALAAPYYYPYGYYGYRLSVSVLRPAVRMAAGVERLCLGARLRLSAPAKFASAATLAEARARPSSGDASGCGFRARIRGIGTKLLPK